MYLPKHFQSLLGFSSNFLSKSSIGKNSAGRISCLAISLALLASNACLAVSEGDSTGDAKISQLETKFFQHDYTKDSQAARVERLEKMVFGEAKTGPLDQRLANLLKVVPTTDNIPAKTDTAEQASPGKTVPIEQAQKPVAPQAEGGSEPVADASQYPAVTALEKRLFGNSFSTEPVRQRLDRLETKVFGKASGSDDLSYRVDRLKERTGIDIAKQAPPGSDWADDDELGDLGSSAEDYSAHNKRSAQQAYGVPPALTPFTGVGQPNLAQPNFGYKPYPGQDGMGMPQQTPDYAAGMGLNQEVTSLEKEIFGKTYTRDPLPGRLSRLEQAVFPEQPPAADVSLPQRVKRLLAVVPLSPQAEPIAQGEQSNTSDYGAPQTADIYGQHQAQNPQQHTNGGLSKIINSISNFISGGSVGGYPYQNGLATDPQTGLLYDRLTGNLIDPMTGAVVGQRMTPGVGGFNSFNNGFAPFGAPGFGGGGMRLGVGGGGFGPGFGMWP
jgi:hypothetical protein